MRTTDAYMIGIVKPIEMAMRSDFDFSFNDSAIVGMGLVYDEPTA